MTIQYNKPNPILYDRSNYIRLYNIIDLKDTVSHVNVMK